MPRTPKTDAGDPPLKPFEIGMNGTWKPSDDGTMMQDGDFKTLTNMRYTEVSIRSVLGTTTINNTQLTVA